VFLSISGELECIRVCDVVVHRGCVLSPLLWNMVTDSLLNRLGNCNCFVQGFADDVVILIKGKFLSTICDLMQRASNCVQNWCDEIGLNDNTDKTSMVLFTKSGNLEGFFSPQDPLTRN
jgi:Reverse transcriptase (RNA-dependent DNA polymerase)